MTNFDSYLDARINDYLADCDAAVEAAELSALCDEIEAREAEKLAAADDVFGAEREILRRELDGVMATDVTEGFVSVRTRRGVYIVDVLALNGARLASVAILHAWEATQLVGWCGRYLSTALEMLERYQPLPADLSA